MPAEPQAGTRVGVRVGVRPLQESDAFTSVAWRNNPEIWTHTAERPTREVTIDDELSWIRAAIAEPTSRRFAILVDGRYVGNAYLTDIRDGVAEYHIFIGEQDYQNKGIGKLATARIMDIAKRTLGITRFELRVRPANTLAVAAYQRVGFREIGVDGEFTRLSLDLVDAP